MIVRVLSYGVIGVLLALAGSSYAQSDPTATQQPQDQYFAGIVTALSDTSVTITRTELGKSTVRTFAVTQDTEFRGGKPKLKSKVTVKWVSHADGDRALKIILRGAAPPPKKP